MASTATTETLFKVLQSAITRKLRSLTQTDATRVMEQKIRHYTLAQLKKVKSTDVQVSLKAILSVEQDGGIKLAELLNDLCAHTGHLSAKLEYPVALMQSVMIKPMNVSLALEYLQAVDPQVLPPTLKFFHQLLHAEVLSSHGDSAAAYRKLQPLLDIKSPPLNLQWSCRLRFAKLAKVRQTQQAQDILSRTLDEMSSTAADDHTCMLEQSECMRELAALQLQCGQNQNALKWGGNALALVNKLLLTQGDRVELHLHHATCLRTVAFAEQALDNYQASQTLFQQAALVIEQLMEKNPQDMLVESELPRSHDVLGDIHLAKLELEKALTAYSASAAIGSHLAFRDPLNVRWQLEEINSAMKVALVLKKMGRLFDGSNMLQTYLPKLCALIDQDPDQLDYRATMAQMKIQMGDLHWAQQLHDLAAQDFQEGHEHVLKAMQRDDCWSRWTLLQLLCMQRLAEIEFSQGQLNTAARTLTSARDMIVKALEKNVHEKKLRHFFVAMTTRLAECCFYSGKTAIGIKVQNEALVLAGQLQKDHPDDLAWKILLASIQTHAAKQLLKLGMLSDSQALLQPALDCLHEQTLLHPEHVELTEQWVRAGLTHVEWLCQANQLNQAYQKAQHWVDALRSNMSSDHTYQQNLLCDGLQHLAFCCHHLGFREQEFKVLQELVGLRRTLLQAQPQSVVLKSQYHETHLAMGRGALKAGLFKPAIAYLNEALKGFDSLHNEYPEHTVYVLAIGEILTELSKAYEQLNDSPAVKLVLSKALLVAGWLARTGQDNYAMRLAAMKLLFVVSQSPVYAHSKSKLLSMAKTHGQHLQSTSINPTVTDLLQAIAQQEVTV